MAEYHIKPKQALEHLRSTSAEQSSELLELGSLSVRYYAPQVVDRQSPHSRDEVYVIASGSATFRCCSKEILVEQGDVLTVPAHQEHLFVNFTPDFATWVFFYGPEGGEKTGSSCCVEELTQLSGRATPTQKQVAEE
jgi:mannose-6-phosphate isomerase-like protein (cupin superfamily)